MRPSWARQREDAGREAVRAPLRTARSNSAPRHEPRERTRAGHYHCGAEPLEGRPNRLEERQHPGEGESGGDRERERRALSGRRVPGRRTRAGRGSPARRGRSAAAAHRDPPRTRAGRSPRGRPRPPCTAPARPRAARSRPHVVAVRAPSTRPASSAPATAKIAGRRTNHEERRPRRGLDVTRDPVQASRPIRVSGTEVTSPSDDALMPRQPRRDQVRVAEARHRSDTLLRCERETDQVHRLQRERQRRARRARRAAPASRASLPRPRRRHPLSAGPPPEPDAGTPVATTPFSAIPQATASVPFVVDAHEDQAQARRRCRGCSRAAADDVVVERGERAGQQARSELAEPRDDHPGKGHAARPLPGRAEAGQNVRDRARGDARRRRAGGPRRPSIAIA